MSSILRLGSKGQAVTDLHIALNHAYRRNLLAVSETFDTRLEQLVRQFQSENRLTVDGVVGPKTWNALHKRNPVKFLLSIHAGHGGISPHTGKYTTKGKAYRHPGVKLHTDDGWFYEGVENRIVANEVAKRLREKDIFVLVTHHEYMDDEGQLSKHYQATLPYLRAGYVGYTHSFHSNAIGGSNPPDVLEKTQGGYVYTSEGDTVSDHLARQLLLLWQREFGYFWTRLNDDRSRRKVGMAATLNSDAEANFQVLREVEGRANINPDRSKGYGALLEEFGFMTSKADALFITRPDTREQRIRVAVELAEWYLANYNRVRTLL